MQVRVADFVQISSAFGQVAGQGAESRHDFDAGRFQIHLMGCDVFVTHLLTGTAIIAGISKIEDDAD
jgi:hypothetical protein